MDLGGHGEALHREDHILGLGLLLVDHEVHIPAHHHLGELFLGGGGHVHGADVLALAEHSAAVGHRHDLVELVGDEEDALALGLEPAHDVHKLVDLLGGEDGGGLIEDEDLIVPVEHLQDLGALLHAHGDILHQGVRVHLQAVFVGEGHDLLPGLRLLQKAPLAGLHAQDDIVQHGEALHQLEVLVDHADAQVVGVVGVLNLHHPAVLLDGALLRPVQAEENAHQRGLAGAVLSQKRVDLTFLQLERNVVVGNDAGEPLGDIQHFDGIWLLQAYRPPSCRIVSAGPSAKRRPGGLPPQVRPAFFTPCGGTCIRTHGSLPLYYIQTHNSKQKCSMCLFSLPPIKKSRRGRRRGGFVSDPERISYLMLPYSLTVMTVA